MDRELKVFAYNSSYSTKTLDECYFRATEFYVPRKGVHAVQNISLESFSLLIFGEIARYTSSIDLPCSGDQYAIIELRFIDINGLRYNGVYSSKKSFFSSLCLWLWSNTNISYCIVFAYFCNYYLFWCHRLIFIDELL